MVALESSTTKLAPQATPGEAAPSGRTVCGSISRTVSRAVSRAVSSTAGGAISGPVGSAPSGGTAAEN